EINWDTVAGLIKSMMDEGQQALMEAGMDQDSIEYLYSSDMRYCGQQTEVTVVFDGDPCDTKDPKDIRARYDKAYEKLYGVRLDDMDVETVSWRITAHGGETGREAKVSMAQTPGEAKQTRRVYFDHKYIEVPVYDRSALSVKQLIDGPVIIEERETTVFILPGWRMTIDEDGSIIANRQEEK
ncbi:MAG: N-methylhydantoinase A, partial [Gammaproteobacteria bacterium]